MRIAILSPCRRGQNFRLSYAGFEYSRTLDDIGFLSTTLDCIAGSAVPVTVLFEDGSQNALTVTAQDLDRVTKVAVLWQAPVNMDLHAFEYGAGIGKPGHVWASAPSSAEEAQARTQQTTRGRGFMSTVSNGTGSGPYLEVYTFWRDARQTSGVVSLAFDYEGRWRQPQDPDTCGNGPYSEIRYEAIVLDRNTPAKRQTGVLAGVGCGLQLSGVARYNTKTLPEIMAKP